MRHGKLNKRFGRNKSARKELMRSLARNTIIYSRVKTTLPKAKEASRLVDRLVTLGKRQTVQSRRAAFDLLQDRTLVARLTNNIAPLFDKRDGGYTRIIRLDNRQGDGAQMAILELTEKIKQEPKLKKKAKVKSPRPKAETAPAKEEVKVKKEKKKKEITKPGAEEPKADIKELKPETKIDSKKKEVPKKEEIKPKDESSKTEKPKKEGWLGKFKGIFRKKKP